MLEELNLLKSQLPEMLDVVSSNIVRMGHNPTTNELVVEFNGGKMFLYSGVPSVEYSGILNSESIGRAYNARIKLQPDKYPCRRIIIWEGPTEPEAQATTKRLEDMTEPELSEYISSLLKYLKSRKTEDTVGVILVIFQENKITQFGSTIHPEDSPAALRELAERIEKRQMVSR